MIDEFSKYDLTEKVGNYQPIINSRMKTFKQLLNWIVWSSMNSEKISLTLKAGIPFLVLLGISNTTDLNMFVGSIGQLIMYLAQVTTGAIALTGVVRKIWFTMAE